MSGTYIDQQSARANFISALGDDVSGYNGNPLLKRPLQNFAGFIATMDRELVNAGGETASADFLASQISDYNRMTSYISKITASNRDSQIIGDADEFYLLETESTS